MFVVGGGGERVSPIPHVFATHILTMQGQMYENVADVTCKHIYKYIL
jgi:hypothetical protein